MTPCWTQPRTPLPDTRLAEDSLPFVGWVLQQLTNREHMPILAFGARNPLLSQAAADLVQRKAIAGDPLKHLLDDARLLEHHLVLRLAAAGMLANVAVAIGSCDQDIHRTATSRMAFAPPATFHNLGPFIFRDHPLHLQQEVFFRTDTDRAIEKHQFDTAPLQLFNQQHLPGVPPGQSIRRVHIQARKAARPSHIAQAFQSGADQGAAAIAVVDKAQVIVER